MSVQYLRAFDEFYDRGMTPDERQQVINELQKVIDDTQATGMDDEMRKDYDKLLEILDDAVKQQREHTRVMLG